MAKQTLLTRYDLLRYDLNTAINRAAEACADPRHSWNDKTPPSTEQVNYVNTYLLLYVAQYLELGRDTLQALDKMKEEFRG